MNLDAWNDGRLDDLSRTVERLIHLPEQVSEMRAQFKSLGDDLRDNTESTKALSRRLDDADKSRVKLSEDTETARRGLVAQRDRDLADRRSQLRIGLITAIVGGLIALLVAFVSGSVLHP